MPTRARTNQTSQERNMQAVAGTKDKRTRLTSPAIDYSALTPEKTESIHHSRGSVLDGTPWVAWVQESYDQKEARKITVPNAAAEQSRTLARLAADRLGLGITVTVTAKGATQSVVEFETKDRRAYKGRKPKETASA